MTNLSPKDKERKKTPLELYQMAIVAVALAIESGCTKELKELLDKFKKHAQ